MPTWRLTSGTRDRISPDSAGIPSARRYEDRVKLGPDGETVPRTCIFHLDRKQEIMCEKPVWDGGFCLHHYIRNALYKVGLLRPFKPGSWIEKRELQTFLKERDAIVAFFTQRLAAVRAETIVPVASYKEAYGI